MFNIGPGELIVILILALVLLGPEKLPEMARTVGKGMRELRRATEDLKDQVETEFYKLDDDKPGKPVVKAPEGPRYPKTTPAIAAPEPVAPASLPASPSPDPVAPASLPASSAPTDPPKTA